MEPIEQPVIIKAISDGSGVILNDGIMYSGCDDKLLKIDVSTGRILLELEVFSNISSIAYINGMVVIGTAGGTVYTYNTEENRLEYLMKENIIITTMEAFNTTLVMGTADGVVITMNMHSREMVFRRVIDAGVTKIHCHQREGAKKESTYSQEIIIIGDSQGCIYSMDSITGKILYKDSTHMGSITFIEAQNRIIYTGSTDGSIIKHTPGTQHKIREVGYAITSGVFLNGAFHLTGDKNKIHSYNEELLTLDTTELSLPTITTIQIYDDKVLLITEENDIAIARANNTLFSIDKVIIGDNDEITDILVLEDTIVISTNSALVRVIQKKDIIPENTNSKTVEYACIAQIVSSPNEECTLSLTGKGNTFYTGTKDGYINRMQISNGIVSLVDSIKTTAAVTAMCTYKKVLFTGMEDGLVKGWNIECGITPLFTTTVSETEITGVTAIGNTVYCSSKDKDISQLGLNGGIITKYTGHKKGIWSLDSQADYLISGSSDKTARIWRDSSSISLLQHNASVIKAILNTRAITATSDGVIRVWNYQKERELAALKLSETKDDRIWAIKPISETQYILNSGGTLRLITDNTQELEKQREDKRREEYLARQEGNTLMSQKKYLEAAIKYLELDNPKYLRDAVKEIPQNQNISPLVQAMAANPNKALSHLLKWSRSPQLFIISSKILEEMLVGHWVLEKTKATELIKTLTRTAEILNDAY
ncbi:U3 small nucleolar RNA-associated protein 13 [Nematocida sp. AWRm80]|nr:U3 small nucleolar RNA-associated protein 13 [Nematocida sp. AWRm80]